MGACRQRLIRMIGLPLIALALFSVAGGHWAILQTIAWARMLKDFARDASIAVAIAKTFNGKNPCALCLKVEEGRQKEDAPVSAKPDKKAENFLRAENSKAESPLPDDFSYPSEAYLTWTGRSSSPPSPPPRLSLM